VRRSRLAQALGWSYLIGVLVILYLPLLPPVSTSVSPTGRQPDLGEITFRWYGALSSDPMLIKSVKTSIQVAGLTGLITPLLALFSAMAVRELRIPRLVLLVLLLPLFIPGVSLGLANAFLFQQIGVLPSLWTVTIVHVLWALPFAFLIVLTAMSTFDPVYLEAAYVHGAGRWRAFATVELPLIWPGVMGSATFSVILSFNETVRTALVQGPLNTVQTYIWSRYLQVGLTPPVYALMSLLILLTLALIGALLVFNLRKTGRGR
jgi:ABC-type spermidine/putrescine transport system permease subunit II